MSAPAADILARLIDGTLEPGGFGHAEHVAVAHAALTRFEFFEAARVIGDGLRALAARAGAAEKFNATVTFAFMSLIAERMAAGAPTDAAEFVRRHPDLAGPGVLAPWYSAERIGSGLARRVALLPDRPGPVTAQERARRYGR